MSVMWSRCVAGATNAAMWVCRLPGLNSAGVYSLLSVPAVQPMLKWAARHRAVAAFERARRRCPAYREFLSRSGFGGGMSTAYFGAAPATTKENYVRAFSIEERCFGGRLPRRGVVIDESSGSSGKPNNWVRSMSERRSVRRLLQHGFALTLPGEPVFLLNCFALGPWATGMNISMSVADVTILKSIGPDRDKLEATLKLFGPKYRYAVAGYPPFIKDFVDSTALDLSAFEMHLLVGGEGISEGLRDRLLKVFKTVHSSYGASDLEINIAVETPFSIAVRRACRANQKLREALFGAGELPMVFQYNPVDYLIETNEERELIFTLLRPGYAAPRVRYNIRDTGGVMELARVGGAGGARGVAGRVGAGAGVSCAVRARAE
jgi:phenylacetate-CoA ligase